MVGLTLVVIGALVGLGQLITRTQSGADPATALNLIPSMPPDLEERLVWLPDRPQSAPQRALEANSRELITGAYLRAWAQWGIALEIGQPYGLATYFSGPALAGVTGNVTSTVASGWTIRQSNLHHELELHYYADDGSIVAFTDQNVQLVQQFVPVHDGAPAVAPVRQSNHRYAVVMILQDGNWRIYQWQRLGDAVPQTAGPWPTDAAAPPPRPMPRAGVVTLVDQRFSVDDHSFTVAGVNYYPQATPWTAFWPNYDPQQIATDLARIRALGLNTVRIFIPYVDFGEATVSAQRQAQLADFLSQARAANLKVIVTLFDHRTDHHPATWAADARHLALLIPAFASHPAILAWDLKNEPDRDYDDNTQALVDEWLRFVARHVRWHDPNHLITIGWSNPEAATALSDVVDFVAYHYFAAPTAYTARIAAVQPQLNNKPLLLEEFTFSTWNSPFYPGQSEAEQANYYAALLNAHSQFDSLGYLVWTLYDFDTVPLAEFRYPWQRGLQAHMGLIDHNGRAKTAATLVAPQATRNLTTIPLGALRHKPFWWLVAGLALLLCAVGVRAWWQGRAHR